MQQYSVRQPTADNSTKIVNRQHTSESPGWVVAIIRLGQPLTYSRKLKSARGKVTDGAFTRADKPFLIIGDIKQALVQNSKRSHTKVLSMVLDSNRSGTNYLDANVCLGGDWVLAWMFNNVEDVERISKAILAGEACNHFADGLKFVGRLHDVRQQTRQDLNSATRYTQYHLQAIGFEELDTQFFYDRALASSAAVSSQIRTFMAQLGLQWSDWMDRDQAASGNIKDNADRLIVALIDIILGKGIADKVNLPTERAQVGIAGDAQFKLAPQANREAPAAYLVPKLVGQLLGRKSSDATKSSGIFGYADILDTLIGCQSYEAKTSSATNNFYPELDLARSTGSRKFTKFQLKGTFLPVNPTFDNRPLWGLLTEYLNPAINELYTAMHVNEVGDVVPTLVARQIPFSTESIEEPADSKGVFKLTRFQSLPRWVLDPTMASEINVGRSNATRVNMVHVYGNAAAFAANKSITNQLVRNPPIFDAVDCARSGIKPIMQTVNCALSDQTRKDGARIWMEAIADWSFGSQFTLNGTITCSGIQLPIAEGDNLEFQGMVYHIESVAHNIQMDDDGNKSFDTTLELSNGMPVDQSLATADFPVYPGFKNILRQNQIQADAGPGEHVTITEESTDVTGDSTVGESVMGQDSTMSIYDRFKE